MPLPHAAVHRRRLMPAAADAPYAGYATIVIFATPLLWLLSAAERY